MPWGGYAPTDWSPDPYASSLLGRHEVTAFAARRTGRPCVRAGPCAPARRLLQAKRTHVAMESTGVYGSRAWQVRGGMACTLASTPERMRAGHSGIAADAAGAWAWTAWSTSEAAHGVAPCVVRLRLAKLLASLPAPAADRSARASPRPALAATPGPAAPRPP